MAAEKKKMAVKEKENEPWIPGSKEVESALLSRYISQLCTPRIPWPRQLDHAGINTFLQKTFTVCTVQAIVEGTGELSLAPARMEEIEFSELGASLFEIAQSLFALEQTKQTTRDCITNKLISQNANLRFLI